MCVIKAKSVTLIFIVYSFSNLSYSVNFPTNLSSYQLIMNICYLIYKYIYIYLF
jgi:hypothetical protein